MFYSRQAHLIDMGEHSAWAETFLPDGEFDSPTYSSPAIGHEALTKVSRAFAAASQEAGEVRRHIVTNVWGVRTSNTTATARVYLMILASGSELTKILRVMTVDDELMSEGERWLVRRRKVSPSTSPID